MSIESQILRIQQNVADAFIAIGEMGGTVSRPASSDALEEAVRSIPSGSGGSPVGTVISYMGTAAPAGYLVCDGALYNVADYPALAQHFKTQFGSANYFGGDGSASFAVPDMRNLFLRGYHGSAEALSGNVGKRQEATEHVTVYSEHSVNTWVGIYVPMASNSSSKNPPAQIDKAVTGNYGGFYFSASGDPDGGYTGPSKYTSRPVNMAVLYCVRAE